jgi:hypothetical protein
MIDYCVDGNAPDNAGATTMIEFLSVAYTQALDGDRVVSLHDDVLALTMQTRMFPDIKSPSCSTVNIVCCAFVRMFDSWLNCVTLGQSEHVRNVVMMWCPLVALQPQRALDVLALARLVAAVICASTIV